MYIFSDFSQATGASSTECANSAARIEARTRAAEDDEAQGAQELVASNEWVLKRAIAMLEDSKREAASIAALNHRLRAARSQEPQRLLTPAELSGRRSIQAEHDELAAIRAAIETRTYEDLKKAAEPAAVALRVVQRAHAAVFRLQATQEGRSSTRAAAHVAVLKEAARSAERRHSPERAAGERDLGPSWADLVEGDWE
ncbi:hypothetical protein MMC13_004479 [Lambiella insularis]|nr:hypothetical protein [Lambiella insularis]